jgi:energy-coupling factor transporter ATP-binding protein EcfA2
VAWLKEVPADRVPDAVERAVARVELADRIDAKVKTLSGGMVRRVGIAQAIVNDPAVLLLDEPTAGLEPEQRVEFRALLRELGVSATVVVCTHLVEDVAAACTEVTLGDAGGSAMTRVAEPKAPTAGKRAAQLAAGLRLRLRRVHGRPRHTGTRGNGVGVTDAAGSGEGCVGDGTGRVRAGRHLVRRAGRPPRGTSPLKLRAGRIRWGRGELREQPRRTRSRRTAPGTPPGGRTKHRPGLRQRCRRSGPRRHPPHTAANRASTSDPDARYR